MAGWTPQDIIEYRKQKNPGQVSTDPNSSNGEWSANDIDTYSKSRAAGNDMTNINNYSTDKPKPITPTQMMSSIPSTNNVQAAQMQPVTPMQPTPGASIIGEKEYYDGLPWYKKVAFKSKQAAGKVGDWAKMGAAGVGNVIAKPAARVAEKIIFNGGNAPEGYSKATDAENYFNSTQAIMDFRDNLGDSVNNMTEKEFEKAFEAEKKRAIRAASSQDDQQMLKGILGTNPQAELPKDAQIAFGTGGTAGQLGGLAYLTALGVPAIAAGAIQGGTYEYGERGNANDITRGAAAGGIFMGVATPVTKAIGNKGLQILSTNPALKNSVSAAFGNHLISGFTGFVAGDQAANIVRPTDEKSAIDSSMKQGLFWAFIGGIPGIIGDVKSAKTVFKEGGKQYFDSVGKAYSYAQSSSDPVVKVEIYGKIAQSLDKSIKDLSPEGNLRFVGQQKKINQAVNMMELTKEHVLREKAAAENSMMGKIPSSPGENMSGNISGLPEGISSAREAIANYGVPSEGMEVSKGKPGSQKVSIPMDQRDLENVGNRKVAAFQFDHPEIKSYIQEEASYILYDINNSIRGERTATTGLDGVMRWNGTDRMTTKTLAQIKDSTGASWDQIQKAIENILKDSGRENNALSKKIELYIDDHLINGTTRIDGTVMPPNAEYIAKRNEINQQLGLKPVQPSNGGNGIPDELMQDNSAAMEHGGLRINENQNPGKNEKRFYADAPIPEGDKMSRLFGDTIEEVKQKIDGLDEYNKGFLKGDKTNEGSQAVKGKNSQRVNNAQWTADDIKSKANADEDRFKAEGILQSGIRLLESYGAKNTKAELVAPTSMTQKQLQDIMKSFGVKVFYYKSENGKFPTDDLVDTGYDDIMLVEKTDNNDMTWNIGHAFGHILESRHKDLYNDMLDFIEKTTDIDAKTKYLDTFSKTPAYQDELAQNPRRLYAEMLNDEIGNNFVDKSFWERLFEYSKDLFNKVKTVLMDFIEKISGNKYENYFTNEQVKTIKEKLTTIMSEVGKTEGANSEAAATKENVAMSAREKAVKEEKNLIAVRNTKENDLLGVLDLGAFPVPSLAVTKDNIPFTSFGDITVIFDKSAIDPKNTANKVYDADIYSVRFPETKREVNRENTKKLIATMKEGIPENYYRDLDNLQYSIWDNERPIDFYARYNDGIAAVYLKEQGKEINEDTIREVSRSTHISSWLADKAEDFNVYGERRIRNNKEVFTYNGDRRSFKQLYDEYTLDNIVRIMKGQTKDTEGFFYGVGNIRASASKKYSSLSGIQKDRSRVISGEEMEKIKEKFDNDLSEVMNKIEPFYKHKTDKYNFGLRDNMGETIAEIAKKPLSSASIQREFAMSQFNPLSDEVVQDIIGFINELRNAPTEYFEAKPQRAVGIHEIRYVVMPNDSSVKLKNALKEANISYLEYKAGDSADRTRVIKEISDENVKFSARDKEAKLAKPFYSKLSKTIEDKMPSAAYVQDIRGIINSGGIKPEEVKWSGIDDFLSSKIGQKVTKQEVQDYIAANDLQIQEVEKGDNLTIDYSPDDKEELENLSEVKSKLVEDLSDIHEKYEGKSDDFLSAMSRSYASLYKLVSSRIRLAASNSKKFPNTEKDLDEAMNLNMGIRDIEDKEDSIVRKYEQKRNAIKPKFDKYKLSGGENYKEILFTLPNNVPDKKAYLIPAYDTLNKIHKWVWEDDKEKDLTQSFESKEEAIKNRPEGYLYLDDGYHEIKGINPRTMDYGSPHWDEKNVLAHTRIDDRTDAEGKKVLFVEEIQSDWHQEGRKKGYKGEGLPKDFTLRETEDSWVVDSEKYGKEKIKVSKKIENAKERAINDAWQFANSVPDAPFQKTWHEFVIKRLIRYAAENGYDKIAWTNGEQQAERYDLSKQVESIYFNKNGYEKKGNEIWIVVKAFNNPNNLIAKYMTTEEIESTLGKEIAKKIIEGEETGTLTGLDLKVGGEGMKGFYDKILPDFVSKYVKKWGGKVEIIKMPQGTTLEPVTVVTLEKAARLALEAGDRESTNFIREQIDKMIDGKDPNFGIYNPNVPASEYVNKARQANITSQMSIDITPSMKESVLYEGQPMFSLRDKQYKDLKDMENDIDSIIAEAMKSKKKTAEAKVNYEGFSDPEAEERWQKAKDFTPSFMERTKTAIEEFMHDMKLYTTRGALPFLERGSKYSELRFKLQAFKKMRAVVSDRTLRNLDGVVTILDKDPGLYDIFSRKVSLDDMAEEIEANHDLGFGFTKSMVSEELSKLNKAVADDERLSIALDFRKKLWQLIKKDYIKVMKDIDFDVGDRFTRDNYFRHIIIENINKPNLTTGAIKLKTPSNAGYLKKREGSLKDYVSDYLQAEAEVMANMLYDIEKAKIIKYIKNSEHNIKQKLKGEAKGHNKQALKDLISKELTMEQPMIDEKGNPISMIEKQIQSFNQKIALGFEGLKNLSELELLWTGEKGEYEDVVKNLTENKKQVVSDINDDVGSNKTYKYLSELIAREEQGAMNAATILKYVSQKRRFVKEALADEYKTWKDLIPEGYTNWQPREGTHFFMAYSVPERIAEKLLEGLMPEAIMTKEKLRGVLTKGMPYEEYVIPEEVAMTFEKLIDVRDEIVPEKMLRKFTNAWKQYQLISPSRMIKYNIRNVTGDIDHILAANPGIMLRSRESAQELFNTMILGKPMTENLRDFFERGGFSSNLQAAEMGDIPKLKNFIKLYGGKTGSILSIPQKVWTKYWEGARLTTDFRETILRYSAYLDYADELTKNGGKVKSLHASIPEEINALKDNRDKAYQLSNDLLGAYDDISVIGQKLRKAAFPFWSWVEVNPKIYYRLMKNAIRNDQFTFEVGSRFLGILGKKAGMFTAIKIGQLILGAMFLNGLMTAWNLLFFSKEEEQLPEDVRNKNHIILGHSGDDILYFNRLGSVSDVFDWIGLDTIGSDVKDIISGKMTIKEKVLEMLQSPFNKIASGAYPFHKMIFELVTGKTTYPDIFNPGTIRDRGIYLARSFGLENEYRSLTGKPLKGGSYARNLKNLFLYSTDPQEAAYWDMYDLKDKFLNSIGKPSGGGSYQTPKSNALYNFKLSLRYGDQKAADKYLTEYYMYGGTDTGLNQSLKTMSPLYGMNQSEATGFIQQLTPKDKEKLDMAYQFYYDTLNGGIESDSESTDQVQP